MSVIKRKIWVVQPKVLGQQQFTRFCVIFLPKIFCSAL